MLPGAVMLPRPVMTEAHALQVRSFFALSVDAGAGGLPGVPVLVRSFNLVDSTSVSPHFTNHKRSEERWLVIPMTLSCM
jgi:hypothetical protein